MRGLAQQFLDPVGIADAGQLHDDARVALLGDLRIDHAGLVDAAADDLDRLLHRPAAARVQRHRRQGQRDGAVRGSRPCRIPACRSDPRRRSADGSPPALHRVLVGVAQLQQDAVLLGLRLQRLVEDARQAAAPGAPRPPCCPAAPSPPPSCRPRAAGRSRRAGRGRDAPAATAARAPGAGKRFGMQRMAPSRQRPRMTAVFRGVKYIIGGGRGFLRRCRPYAPAPVRGPVGPVNVRRLANLPARDAVAVARQPPRKPTRW